MTYSHVHVWHDSFVYVCDMIHSYICVTCFMQPIADRVAQNLEIVSKNFQFSTRRTRILMGLIIYYLELIVNPMRRILVRWKRWERMSIFFAIPCAIGCTCEWRDSLYICVTWLIHIFVWHDSFIHLCEMTHPYMCVPRLIRIYVHSHATHIDELYHTYK